MVAMARQEDRAKIKLGPARFDSPKAIRDRIAETIQETPATALVGGVTIDDVQDAIDNYVPVTGGVGQVIGIPPGTPFVYVPPNLVNFPINSLALYPLNPDNFAVTGSTGARTGFAQKEVRFSQDTSNVMGQGTDALLAYDAGTNSLVAFSPSAGTVASVSLGGNVLGTINGFFTTNGELITSVSHGSTVTGNITAKVYDGSTVSTITLAQPASTHRCIATGPDSTGTNILALWVLANSSTTTVSIRTYNTAGTVIATRSEPIGLLRNLTTAVGVVENGYLIFTALRGTVDGVAYIRQATTGAQAWTEFVTDRQAPQNSMTVGPSGTAFVAINQTNSGTPGSRIDLLKLNAVNGVTIAYADALTNVVDPFNVANTSLNGSTTGLCYVDDNNVILTGRLIDPVGPPHLQTPVYAQAVTGSGGTITVTQTTFPSFAAAFATAPGTISNYQTSCFSPFVLANGTAVFIIQTAASITAAPSAQFIENVST